MNKLVCRINSEDNYMRRFNGLNVTVTKISRNGRGTLTVECVLNDDPAGRFITFQGDEIKKGHVFRTVYTDELMPVDTSMVPETHNKNDFLRRIWIFGEASDDAWYRGPPLDMAKYEADYGAPWTDVRKFDVGQKT